MTEFPRLLLSAEKQFKLSPKLYQRMEELDIQEIDACGGPSELTVLGIKPDLVFAKEAWPHTDPAWEGRTLFTLTAQGQLYQFGTASNPNGLSLEEGAVFVVNPLELHWLRPDSMVSHCWLGIQWDVPHDQVEAFEAALVESIQSWNQEAFCLPTLGYY